MTAIINEKQLSEIWRRQALNGGLLFTEDGRPLTVVYPGRLNDGRGGDYCDAVVNIGGLLLSGQVELHVDAADWCAHNHQRDHNFNHVILHVVLHNRNNRHTILANGDQIPILALEKNIAAPRIAEPSSERRFCYRSHCPGGKKEIIRVLEEGGEARFKEKAVGMEKELVEAGAGEVLYRGIMEALGYSRNREPFRLLATIVPLAELESLSTTGKCRDESQSLVFQRLLEASGLGSAVRQTCAADSLGWEVFRTRPGNSPVLRLAAMAALLERYRQKGLLRGLVDIIVKSIEAAECRQVINGLVVGAEQVAGLALPEKLYGLTPLGADRAGVIAANIILPFAWAFGRYRNDMGLSQRALNLCRLQKKTVSNSVERHMVAQLGIAPRLINSALRQQGLLHLYRRYCVRGDCIACWSGQGEVGDDIESEIVGTAVA
jgi:hypothetical protein